MHNIQALTAALLLTVSQATYQIQAHVAASTQVPSQVDVTSENRVKFTPASANPVQVQAKPLPDFETEVLAPLRVAQETAKKAALAKLAAQRKPLNVGGGKLFGPVTGDIWYQLRLCEAGNDYRRNSGNGYYGAYQFSISSWNNFKGYARADLAPPEIQDMKAQETQARRGWYPWPSCARKLGLI